MQLIALQPITVEGRPVAIGETFEVSPVNALALTYQRKARFPKAGETPAKRRKRTYKRRDMTAE